MADAGDMKTSVKIGIIGGSGLDDPDILTLKEDIPHLQTPFGEATVKVGTIKGVDCVLLARHGTKHTISPTDVNYRANIYAMRQLECTHLLVSTACGSLKEEIRPGDLVIPDDFIDRTTKRSQTFGESGICHLPMFPAFHERTREILISTAEQLGYSVHKKATVVTIEGPRFSSRAESRMFCQWGGDIINMTTCPEVVLAKEAGILYSAVAIATDYDCWRAGFGSVCVQDVLKTFSENVTKVKAILVKAVENIAQQDWTEDIKNAKKCVLENTMSAKH